MPIDVQRHPTHTYIFTMEMSEQWTVSDIVVALDEIHRFADQHNNEGFYCVVDLRMTKHVPSGLIQTLLEIDIQRCQQFQGMVIIGANRLFRAMFTSAKRIGAPIASTIIFAETWERALEIIEV